MALTYDTQSEALRAARDLRNFGQPVRVDITPEGKYKISYLPKGTTQKGIIELSPEVGGQAGKVSQMHILEMGIDEKAGSEPTEEEIRQGILEKAKYEAKPEVRIRKGIKEKKIQQQIEKATQLSPEEEIQQELERAERKLKVKKALAGTEEEKEKAYLEMRKEELKREQDRRKRRGITELGEIEAIRDPNTLQITDYKLTTLSGPQKRQEMSERQIRNIETKVKKEFQTAEQQKRLGKEGLQTFATTVSHIQPSKISTGRKTAIVGLASKMPGSIGTQPSKIAQIPKEPEIIKSHPTVLKGGGFNQQKLGEKIKWEPKADKLKPQ